MSKDGGPIYIGESSVPQYLQNKERDGTGWIEDILHSMSSIVPLDISLDQVADINDRLRNISSPFNAVWKDHGKTVGFLVCEEQLYQGEKSLYIRYFGFTRPENGLPDGSVTSHVRSLIDRAQSNNFSYVTCHGFNENLNGLLTNIFGFHHDENYDLEVPGTAQKIPFLAVALNPQTPAERALKSEVDLSELRHELFARIPLMTDDEWHIVSKKIQTYLEVTGQASPDSGWISLVDALAQSWVEVQTTNMGIARCIEVHQTQGAREQRRVLVENATDTDIKPELLAQTRTHSLVRLTTSTHLDDESQSMNNCVGNSNHYLDKIIKGESQIWSMRGDQGQPLLTIEYLPKMKKIRQMKKFDDELVTGEELWFSQIWQLFAAIQKPPHSLIINGVSDLEDIIMRPDEFLILAGGLKSRSEIDQLIASKDVIIKGEIQLTPSMSKEEIEKWCLVSGMTIDTTQLSDEQRENIRDIKGNLKDNSRIPVKLINLISVGGDVFLSESQITELPQLQSIGGSAFLSESQITELPQLQSIGGSAFFNKSQITQIPRLESIGGNTSFLNSCVVALPALRSVGGDALFDDSSLVALPNLISIGGFASFRHYKTKALITELPRLKSIGGNAFFGHSQITHLPSLEFIGGDASFENSLITELPSLILIVGHVGFNSSRIVALPALRSIGGDAYFDNSQITHLPSLESIGGDANFTDSLKVALPALRSVGGSIVLANSQITHLPSLESIGGDAKFRFSNVTELPRLKSIDGSTSFEYSQITHLPSLESIGGVANFRYSRRIELPQLQLVGGNAIFVGTGIVRLPALRSVGGDADFDHARRLIELPALQSIGRNAYFKASGITELPHLQSVDGSVFLSESQITHLPSLESVRGDVFFENSPITELPKLQSIGGTAFAMNSELSKLPRLHTLEGSRKKAILFKMKLKFFRSKL